MVVARIVGIIAMMVIAMMVSVIAMMVVTVMMVVVMTVAVPSCGWDRAAGGDCANNT